MSATNNEMIAALPESIKFAARGNKIVFGSVLELTVDPALNIRFRAGSEIFGVKIEKDTYDLPSMKQQIVDGGGIREPLWISVRKDGSKVLVRGNRRTLASLELLEDEALPKDLRKALTENVPMLLFHGLTEQQERELVNDQTQKSFLRSEVIRNVFDLRRDGWDFMRIALVHWESLGRFTGNSKNITMVRELTDPTAKREKIKSWLRGTLDNYIIWGYDLGKWMQKCIMLSVMRTDGLLNPEMEKPYFDTEKNSQKRIAALKKAKELDGSKFNGQMLVEGSEFKKVADQFRQEDYGTVTPTVTTPAVKMMTRKELEAVKDSFQSQAVRQMILRILDNKPVPTLTNRDEFAAMCETKEMLVEQYLPKLRPEVAAVIRMCFVNPDPVDFQGFLASNCVEEENEVTQVSLPEGETEENQEAAS